MTFSRPQKLAPFILNALLASFMMTSTSAGSSHYSLPSEDNVFSPPICTTNQDGFGGTIGTDVLTIDYNYEMEVVVGADVNDVLFSVERSIADYLLQTDEFADIPCDDRRLKAAESIAATRREARRLNAVGLTVNPPDLPIDGVTCENDFADGNDCHVIAGGFQIYTVGGNSDDDGLSAAVKNQLKEAMNNGDFDDADDSIVKITYVDDLDANSQKGDEINEIPNPSPQPVQGSSTGVIIGASAGALFLIGGLAFYRRRQGKPEGDDDFTQNPGSAV